MESRLVSVRRFLQVRSLAICLSLGLVIALVLAFHIIATPMVPIADGLGYAMRTFALYGYLHTEQWSAFGKLFSNPGQSILAPHDLPFLLLPKIFAGTTAYAVLQQVTTYGVLALGVFELSRVMNRAAWAPAIFLLSAVNNIALIDFYSFFLDMEFCALAVLVIAWQMKAWRENRGGVRVGWGLGLLFFLKPANAVIFLVTWFLAEAIHAGYELTKGEKNRRECLRNLVGNGTHVLLGLMPVLLVAFACGGGQTILQLIEQNEVHQQPGPVDAGGLLRLFYFPLCFSACYHVMLLGGLMVAAVIVGWWMCAEKSETSFPLHLFLPVVMAYLILGEFFSFWMLVKPVRSLLMMLPLFWMMVAWVGEKRRVPAEFFLLVAMVYASVAFAQKSFNLLGTRDHLVEDTYQLSWASWTEMPSPWHRGPSLNHAICEAIGRNLPPQGIVCVNALEIRNALTWQLQNDSLLRGEPPPYVVRNLFDYKGEYDDHALVGASRVALITFLPVQSSRQGWNYSMGVLDYGNTAWCGTNAIARLSALPSVGDEPVGSQFTFTEPLTQAQVDQANAESPFVGMNRVQEGRSPDSLYGRHYTRQQAEELLKDWTKKRFR